jgi:ABC-2 type transport system permease protein
MKVRKLNRTLAQEIGSELKMALEYIKSNLTSAAELRASFIGQVVGMMINDISFLLIWVFFFGAFGRINGWGGIEVAGLQGFLIVTYGISFSLFAGAIDLPIAINNGAFDTVLLTPRNVYLRILTLVTRIAAIGDGLYGAMLLLAYALISHLSPLQIGLLILLLIPSVLILTNFALIASCIGFFVLDSAELSKSAFELLVGPSLYPAGLYQGATRAFFLFVIPSIAIGGLPVEAVKSLDLTGVAIVWILAVVWTLIALWVLRHGIKRYESGNLTGARI